MSMTHNGLPLSPTRPSDSVLARLPLPTGPAPIRPPGPSKPTTQLSREQILDATLDALRQDGYDGTTIRNIARRLNCAVGSIYRYFRDKRTLLDAVTQRLFEPLVGQLEAGASLDTAARAYDHIARGEPEIYRLMFWLHSVGHTSGGATIPPIVARILDHWTDRFQGDTRQAQRFWSQLHGSLMLGLDIETDAPAPPAQPTIVQTTPPPPSRVTEDMTLL